tara:strand:- start:66702 stop:69959 length:3258 start_codon:yes stop_codon:yes gene_type:complete
MLNNASTSASSTKKSKTQTQPNQTGMKVIHAGTALRGLSQEQAIQRLLGFLNPETQDKALIEASRVELAISEFHTILDDKNISNKLDYLDEHFDLRHQDALRHDPIFLSQLSQNLSAYYNRFIHPSSTTQTRSQKDLYQNIIVREKKIIGTLFLKQYIDKNNLKYGDVYLSLNIVLIMNNLELIRECSKLLMEPSLEPIDSDYKACLRRAIKAIKAIQSIEEELTPILKVAFIYAKNESVEGTQFALEEAGRFWVERAEDVDRVSQNLYQLHLSFLHYTVYNAQLLSILGDYSAAKDAAQEGLLKAKWAISNVRALLQKTVVSEQNTLSELTRNEKQCQDIITLVQSPKEIHIVQYGCYLSLFDQNTRDSNTLSDNVFEQLKQCLPTGSLSTYPEKFSTSLQLWPLLAKSKDKSCLEAGYRHWLNWQLWICNLKSEQILSGKICQVSMAGIGLTFKDRLKEITVQLKKEEAEAERQHKEILAKKAADSLLREEKIRKRQQAKQREEKRKRAQAKKANLREQNKHKQELRRLQKQNEALAREAEIEAQAGEQAKQKLEQQEKHQVAMEQKQAKAIGRKKAKQARKRFNKKLRQQRDKIELGKCQPENEGEKLALDVDVTVISEGLSLLSISKESESATKKTEQNLAVKVESLQNLAQDSEAEKLEKLNVEADRSALVKDVSGIALRDKPEEWVAQRCAESLLPSILIPDSISTLMSQIEAKGYIVLLYGGFVRDSLLKIRANDHDFVTNCPINILREIQSFSATPMKNCYTLGPYIDITVMSDFDLVAFSQPRYLADNALFATKEGKTFAATDEIYTLLNSPYLLPTKTRPIESALIQDPSRILRCVYYASHTQKALTLDTIEAMRSCAKKIMQKVPFGVLKARLDDLFLKGHSLPNLTFLYDNKLMSYIVPQPNNEIEHYVYQFISNQLHQIDIFVCQNGVKIPRLNIFALLLFPYYQYLLTQQNLKQEELTDKTVQVFCDMFADNLFPQIDQRPFIKQVAATISQYEKLYLHFKAMRIREEALAVVAQKQNEKTTAASSAEPQDRPATLTVQYNARLEERPNNTKGERTLTYAQAALNGHKHKI